MTLKLRGGWKEAEPESIRVGQKVRILTGRTPSGYYRRETAVVTKLLKGGFGVEVRLPDGRITTRDTADCAVAVRPRRAKAQRR